jgi:formylglycine-generating enzyme required for sulfatase activity
MTADQDERRRLASLDGRDMARIEAGAFSMGSEDFYPEERPVRRVAVDGFWIDRRQVTNAEYARFIEATGHVTEAQRSPDPTLYPGAPPENLVPGSLVFMPTAGPVDLHDYSQWWVWTPGADWRHPTGPESSVDGLADHPVVHVAYGDVVAYCEWAGTVPASEAEWEYAARGGRKGAAFTWGGEDTQETDPKANTWQGQFPWQNTEVDGWTRTAPVGLFEPNGYGLYDMAGNVWEWTDDWYRATHSDPEVPACCVPENPRGGTMEASLDPLQPFTPIPRKVLKGGSHLCAASYCLRYRPAARQPQMIDTGMSHLGFRTIIRALD